MLNWAPLSICTCWTVHTSLTAASELLRKLRFLEWHCAMKRVRTPRTSPARLLFSLASCFVFLAAHMALFGVFVLQMCTACLFRPAQTKQGQGSKDSPNSFWTATLKLFRVLFNKVCTTWIKNKHECSNATYTIKCFAFLYWRAVWFLWYDNNINKEPLLSCFVGLLPGHYMYIAQRPCILAPKT